MLCCDGSRRLSIKKQQEKTSLQLFGFYFRSLYLASLTSAYLWYSPSTAYAANDKNEKENTIRGYSRLFARGIASLAE